MERSLLDLNRTIVIVGGSAAGVEAARAIAGEGQGEGAMLLTAERRLPYKRTKVSKCFAAGFDGDAFALADEAWWSDQGIDLRLGARAVELDPEGHTLTLESGERVRWERLILATGAEARRIPTDAAAASRVHHAHDIAQVEALRAAARVEGTRTALVVGTGAMGVEVAEQLRRMGLDVTLSGDTRAPLAHELNGEARRRLARILEENGVRLRCGELVREVVLADGALTVAWDSGPGAFDLVASCVGTRPRVGLARCAGLQVDRGVLVDQQLRTSCTEILAAGDAAQHPDGRVTYLWRHAMHQGRVAGLNALGGDERYAYEPFRLKVKVFGHYFFALDRPAEAEVEAFQVCQGGSEARYVCAYFRRDRLEGLVMVDDEPNQKLYNQAVVERWDRARVEEVFGL